MSEEKKAPKPRYRARKDYKELIKLADAAIEVKGKGRKRGDANPHIIVDEARDLFDEIAADGKYSEAEKLAAKTIREDYEFTDAGRTVFAELLRDWALERGRATQAANRAAEEKAEAEAAAKKKSEAEAKAAAKAAKAAAKKKAEAEKAAAKKEGKKVATSTIGEDVLDRRLVKLALKFVGENITTAREHLSDEENDSSVGGRQTITKDDVQALVDYVYADGEYSDLEKDTMNWIRSNIGMSKSARAEWAKLKGEAERAAKKKA